MKPRRPPISAPDEAIEATAAAWLAERDEGLTAPDQAEFDRWRSADPRHAAAVARLEKTWTTLQQLREFRPAARQHPDGDLLAGGRRPRARLVSFPAIAALAGLAAVLAVVALLRWRPVSGGEAPAVAAPVEGVVYATTTDGYQRVTLEDGSVLELNADSRVRVHFSSAERRTVLERGEAHFTVAKNAVRPFVVLAQSVAVRAVGTAFNVRLAEREVEVLVTEGRVQVGRLKGGILPPGAHPECGAGQRLVVSTAAAAPLPPDPADMLPAEDIQRALAWQGPRLRFADTPLAEVIAQFNRHNRIQVELGDASLGARPVDGSFRSENVEAFIRLLESDRSIAAERIGTDRIILRRAP